MNGFERRKKQKEESIQRAALEQFKAHGFKKVSINEIAQQAGVSPVTIYNHFGSKEELVRRVIKAQLTGMLEKYRQVIEGDSPFPEILEAIVFDKAEIGSQYQGELMQTAIQSDPELKGFIGTLWQQQVNQLTTGLFEKGKRQGYVNPGITTEALLLYLTIIRNGVFASTDLLADIVPDKKFIRELNYLFIYGLVGKKE